MKSLNLNADDRIGVRVTFDVNHFVIYGSRFSQVAECRLTAAQSNKDLRDQITFHAFTGVSLDALATQKYLAGDTAESDLTWTFKFNDLRRA